MRSKNGGAKAPSTTTANPKLDQTIKDGNNSRPPETTASMNKKSLGRPTVKLLPPETREAVWTRTFVVTAFWCVVLFLGLPMWWKTTSVYREKIPLDEMQDWADGNVCAFQHLLMGDADRPNRFANLSFPCTFLFMPLRYLARKPII